MFCCFVAEVFISKSKSGACLWRPAPPGQSSCLLRMTWSRIQRAEHWLNRANEWQPADVEAVQPCLCFLSLWRMTNKQMLPYYVCSWEKKWFFIGYLRKWTFNHFLSLHTRGSVSSILWFWKLWPTAQNNYFNTSNSLGHNCQNLKQKSLKYFTLNVANLEYIKSFLNDKKP